MDLDTPCQSDSDPEILPDAPGLDPVAPEVLHRLLRLPREERRHYRPFSIDIDIDLIQTWRRDCHYTHGNCCNDRYTEALSRHIKHLCLVDVTTGCLVTLPSSTPYVALSYVWGDVSVLKTTSRNLQYLQREGALFSGIAEVTLPATIRDAMHLVKSLGERYLWVDCLCIVQDAGADEMNAILQAMAYIYASAEFTIAAAGGRNANHGLPGVGGPSRKRCPEDVKSQPSDLLDGRGYPYRTQWAQRGWTFQESLFSRRLLVFDTVTSWSCGKDVRYECVQDIASSASGDVTWPDERPHSGSLMGLMSLLLSVPCLGRWGLLVQDYSRRILSFEDDTVRAFAGATNVMGSRFPGGMLHGLPVFYFDIAMLWEPVSKMERRPGQPSWSWTGWKGHVECQNRWSPHFAGLYCDTGESSDWMAMAPLKPVATYTSTMDWDMAGLNGFYTYQAFRNDVDRPLPPGWTRHHHAEGHFYTKDDICGGESPYGFPLPDAESVQSVAPVLTSPILLCTAPLARVLIGGLIDQPTHGFVKCTRVYNEHGTAELFLCGSADSLSDVTVGDQCQLVAISEAEVEQPELMAGWCLTQHGKWEGNAWDMYNSLSSRFYNVLWVQWEDGVAYRKALGMMNKSAYDALRPQMHSFRLG